MKKVLIFTTFILSSLTAVSQDFTVNIYLEDNVGRKDTVTIGYNELSTIDIDSNFGEENIYGDSFDSLDVRIIQRDSLNFNCLRATHFSFPAAPNFFFSNNVDSKVDIRPFNWNLDSGESNFEIFIQAIDYPLTVTAIREDLYNNWIVGGVHLLDNDCNSFDFFEVGSQHTDSNPQVFSIENNSFNTLVFEYEVLVSTDKINSVAPTWAIFPNPAKDKLEIEHEFSFDGQFDLINTNGQIIKSFEIEPGTKKILIDIEAINKGIYFIRYINKNERISSVKKFIKI